MMLTQRLTDTAPAPSPTLGRFASAPFYKRHSLLGNFLSAALRAAENSPIRQRSFTPLHSPKPITN